jgi:excisionase family DNA binding protein
MTEPLNPFAPLFAEIEKLVRRVVREELANLNGSKPLAQKEWLKASELSELYGLPKTFFEERGRAGEIERTKPGRYVLFKRRDVEAYLEKRKRG